MQDTPEIDDNPYRAPEAPGSVPAAADSAWDLENLTEQQLKKLCEALGVIRGASLGYRLFLAPLAVAAAAGAALIFASDVVFSWAELALWGIVLVLIVTSWRIGIGLRRFDRRALRLLQFVWFSEAVILMVVSVAYIVQRGLHPLIWGVFVVSVQLLALVALLEQAHYGLMLVPAGQGTVSKISKFSRLRLKSSRVFFFSPVGDAIFLILLFILHEQFNPDTLLIVP